MPAELTQHAKERGWERLKLREAPLQKLADEALELGLKQGEVSGKVARWLASEFFRHHTANNMRVWHGIAFVFHDSRLITLFPVPCKLRTRVARAMTKR